ncbi:hypothetical protein JOC34_000612 [Virgibacillus halotolerans]|nr:hypothetical protein [Virgibacillus halotolerans]
MLVLSNIIVYNKHIEEKGVDYHIRIIQIFNNIRVYE